MPFVKFTHNFVIIMQQHTMILLFLKTIFNTDKNLSNRKKSR